jgi:hypothetical protein
MSSVSQVTEPDKKFQHLRTIPTGKHVRDCKQVSVQNLQKPITTKTWYRYPACYDFNETNFGTLAEFWR